MKWTAIALLFAACAFAQKPPKPPKPPKPGLYATFKTDFGDIRALLFEKDTPVTVRTFVGLAQGTQPWRNVDRATVRKPFYDNTTFFRIIPETAVQAGSPTGKNTFDCGFVIKDEILPGVTFQAGSLAIANGGPDTGSCQFFITAGPMKAWDGKYTIFGTVVEGLDVVDKMTKVKVHDETPIEAPKLISVTISRVGPAPEAKKTKK
jgi:cyclophilin family peptidyl-prolyl cis-trans isomerase